MDRINLMIKASITYMTMPPKLTSANRCFTKLYTSAWKGLEVSRRFPRTWH